MEISERAGKIFDVIAPYICHIAWCSYMLGIGQSYNLTPTEENLKSQKDALEFFKTHPDATPEDSHNNWMKFKIATGWSYGLAKDPDNKRHPDLRPWKELPREEQNKDINDLQAKKFALLIAQVLADEPKTEE